MDVNRIICGPRPEIAAALHELRFTRFLNSRMLPAAPKGFCKWCGLKAARIWCSDKCREEGYVRMGYFNNYLFKRDRGVCAVCGIDTVWLHGKIREIKSLWRRHRHIPYGDFMASFGPWWAGYNRLWEADHIVPVCEGGGCCGLENYQTLCLKCHKKDTAKLSKKRAVKEQKSGQMPLFK